MLFMQSLKSGDVVYEGKAVSSGNCHAFAPIAPYIIKSILNNFPDGKVGTVELPSKVDC